MEAQEKNDEKNFRIGKSNNMFNEETKLAFIKATYSDMEDKCLKSIIAKFNKFGEFEKSATVNKDLMNFNHADFMNLFTNFHWGYNSFHNIKSIIKIYLDWCYDNKLVNERKSRQIEEIPYTMPSHRQKYDIRYFSSLLELHGEIEIVKNMNYKKSRMLKVNIAEIALYLLWSGINIQDICEIRKDDIYKQQRKIYIRSTDQYVSIKYDKQIDILEAIDKFINSKEYICSNMLMRTDSQAVLTKKNIQDYISRHFGDNKASSLKGKIITCEKVYWSGIYSRAVTKTGYTMREIDMIDRNNFSMLSDIFKEDYANDPHPKSAICIRLMEYKDYLSYVFSEKYYRK